MTRLVLFLGFLLLGSSRGIDLLDLRLAEEGKHPVLGVALRLTNVLHTWRQGANEHLDDQDEPVHVEDNKRGEEDVELPVVEDLNWGFLRREHVGGMDDVEGKEEEAMVDPRHK